MAESTYEEACRCPKCKQPGKVIAKRLHKEIKGAELHSIECQSRLCRWFETTWLVQVNADGSVPPPQDHRNRPKEYVGFEGHDGLAKQIEEALELQRQIETDPSHHGEIRNPGSR